MAIDTIRVRSEPAEIDDPPVQDRPPGVVDVSALTPARVRALVDSTRRDVYLERRAGRTFLVAAE